MTDKQLHVTLAGKLALLRAELGVEPMSPRIVAISGSTRFIEEMAVHAWTLEKRGIIALGCHLLPAWYGAASDHQGEAEGVAETLDKLHLHKIDLADELHVVCTDEHLGSSTKREIEYARARQIPVILVSRQWIMAAATGRGTS